MFKCNRYMKEKDGLCGCEQFNMLSFSLDVARLSYKYNVICKECAAEFIIIASYPGMRVHTSEV